MNRCWLWGLPLGRWLLDLRLLMAGLFLTWCGWAQAENLMVDQMVLEDPSGQLTVDQLKEQDFEPLHGLLSKGYSASAFWLKLRVRPAPQREPIQLRVRPSYLDDVRLYESVRGVPGRAWLEHVTGDTHPVNGDRVGASMGFTVQPASQGVTTYFLRLRTSSSALMAVEAMPRVQAVQADLKLAIWGMLYLALVVSMAIWALVSYVRHKEAPFLAFGLYQLSNVFYGVMILGWGAAFDAWMGAGQVSRVTSWTVIGAVFLALWFHRTLFVWLGLKDAWLNLIDTMILCVTALFVVYGLGLEQEALQANAIMIMVAAVVLFFMAWRWRKSKLALYRVVRWVYALQLASLVVSTFPLLGEGTTTTISLYGPMLYGVIAATLMFYVLRRRAIDRASTVELEKKTTALAQQQLDLQRNHSQEQEQFINMLTHELKTPVAVALMSLDRIKEAVPSTNTGRIHRALNNINRIIERARWSEMASHQKIQPALRLASLSEQVFESVEATLEPDRIHVNVVQPADVAVDVQLLGIILSNLLDNALKYSPPSESVQVWIDHAVYDGRWGVEVRVINAIGGAGEPDSQRLFTKYYRSAGAGAISGSGLGLYLANHLAGLLSGHVSWQGRGGEAVFVLWLPL